MAEVKFYEFEVISKKMPVWQRSYGISETGEFYLPAVIAGDEQAVMMCAAYDGVSFADYKNHVYIPLSWAKREYPKAAEVWTAFEGKMAHLGHIAADN